MMAEYDEEDLVEFLAEMHGCSNGTCGYDFDTECYWWLQNQVENERKMRRAEDSGEVMMRPARREAERPPRSADILADRARSWFKAKRYTEEERSINMTNALRKSFGPVINQVMEFEHRAYNSPIFLAPPMMDIWERKDTVLANEMSQPKILGNCDAFFHGGPLHNQSQFIKDDIQLTIKWGCYDPEKQTGRIYNYRLVLLDQQPHYFYVPQANPMFTRNWLETPR